MGHTSGEQRGRAGGKPRAGSAQPVVKTQVLLRMGAGEELWWQMTYYQMCYFRRPLSRYVGARGSRATAVVQPEEDNDFSLRLEVNTKVACIPS